MKYFLRICFACLCMLAFSHTHIQAQAPAITQMYVYNGSGLATPTNIPIHTPVYLKFNKDVFAFGGAAFASGANVASFFTLSLLPANPIPVFTATIDATSGGQFITIIFGEQLRSSTTYTFTLAANSVQDGVAAPPALTNALQTISFQTASAVTVAAPTITVCNNLAPESLGNIAVTEVSSASFGEGINQTFEIAAPAGFSFVAGSGNVSPTGTDIQNVSLFVTTSKITLLYDVVSYGDIDAISIQSVNIVATAGATNTTMTRTGGNAAQAENRVAFPQLHATLNVATTPSAPVVTIISPTGNKNLCSGFNTATQSIGNITAGGFPVGGGTLKFYNALTNTLVGSVNSATTILSTTLGYNGSNNAILGVKNFYMTMTSTIGGCESAKVPFTITINPAPVVNITPSTVTSAICTPDQITFTAVGTSGASFVFELSTNNFSTAPTTVSTTSSYTTPTNLAANNYQLRVLSTVAGCTTTSSTVTFTVLGAKPTVAFIWTATTNYTTADSPVDLEDPAAIPTFGGRVNGTYNTVGGVYSGVSVAGTKFYPASAPIGIHRITYTYTNAAGCTSSAFVDFNVSDGSNAIVGINTSYCQSDPISGAVTPKPAFVTTPPAAAGITPDNLFNVFPNCFTCTANQFMFPIYPGYNQGIVFSGGIYTFNPNHPSIVYPGASNSVNIYILMITFKNTPNALIFIKSITVYKTPVLTTNLNISNKDFCPSTPPLTIIPSVFGVSPTSGTTTLEYYLTITPASIFTLPANTITPSSFVAGNYTLKYTYTSAQGCSAVLTTPFVIKSNAIPIMAIQKD